MHSYKHIDAGQQRELEGPRANICSDCFNRVFDFSIRVYRSFEAHKQSEAQSKMPQLPPPLGGPVYMQYIYQHFSIL